MRFHRDALMLGAAIGAATAAWLSPSTADACGGFFCNSTQPVNQAAERIIFAHQPNGHVAAVIQIQYSGPSERFSWLLPVQGTPTVSVSSNSAFTALQGATNPLYQLTTTIDGTCRDASRLFPNAVAGAPSGGPGTGSPGAVPDFADSGVRVADAGSVGPYDYVTLEFDGPMENEQFELAREWLEDNDFDVPGMSRDVIEPYLDMGMNLIAFRLTKGTEAGSIRPIILDFGEGDASIPLRPTALAANPDMGVMVFVAGQNRAVPANYSHLELNEALINWLSPNANYNDVVTLAANESGGQGFVTEMAGRLDAKELIYPEFQRTEWESISRATWTEVRSQELLNRVLGLFGSADGIRDVLMMHVRPPDGVSQEQFLSCPQCNGGATVVDAAAFLAAVREDVIVPLENTAKLFEDAPYLTRLYTTMSADEMTVDPIFQFNGDLPDFSNTHMAERIIECSPSVFQSEAPWRIELPDGRLVVRGMGTTWPFNVVADGPMPANSRILRVGTSGDGRVVTDNTGRIRSALSDHNDSVPTVASGGCSIGPRRSSPGRRGRGSGADAALLGFGLAGLALAVFGRGRNGRRKKG